jgi:hypothetical protein
MKQYKDTQYMVNQSNIIGAIEAKASDYADDIDKMYRSEKFDTSTIEIYTAIRTGLLLAVKLIEKEELIPLNY